MKKNYTLPLLALAFLFINPCMVKAQVDVQDSLALVDLYNSTDGSHWKNNTGWLTTQPVSKWFGVSTSYDNKHVKYITLSDNNLKGILPSSIANMSYIEWLRLDRNKLAGILPPELGNIINLTILLMENNELSGVIPSELSKCKKLHTLDLSHNQLTGNIPPELNSIPNLSYSVLSYNKLTGSIPTNFITGTMRELHLDHNQLTDTIPSQLFLSNILELYLNDNQLSGSIPQSIPPDIMRKLYLNNNYLSGSIPAALCDLSNLHELRLNNNQLSGEIPSKLENLVWLGVLDLSNNKLRGGIPFSLGNLKYLSKLYLAHNNLNGNIPSSLGNLRHLKYLFLSDNKLTGKIPSSFSQLANLISFHAGYNRLSDTAPAFLATLPRLNKLGLAGNNYTFDGLEQLTQHNYEAFTYIRQHKINIHQTNNILSVYAGGTLSNNTYKWYKDDVLTATIVGDSTYTPTSSGTYTVQVTNSIATQLTLYSDTVTFATLTASKQNDITAIQTSDKNNFSIYPNPAKTTTTVAFNATGNCVVKITDVSGRMLQSKTITAIKGRNILQLDVSEYAAGVYFVTLSSDKTQTQTLKFSKE